MNATCGAVVSAANVAASTAPALVMTPPVEVSPLSEDGENAAIVVVGGHEVEFREDIRCVLGDDLLADAEPPGDGGVGAALRHQSEHVPFPCGEPPQGGVGGVARQELRHHIGVHRAAARGHAAHAVDELAAVEDAVLEQIADPARTVRQQLTGVELFHVLREHEHREPRDPAARLDGGAQAFVGEGGREPYVDERDVRPVFDQGVQECGAGVHGGGDLESMGGQEAHEPFPQEEKVFGENNAHGISIVAIVGPP